MTSPGERAGLSAIALAEAEVRAGHFSGYAARRIGRAVNGIMRSDAAARADDSQGVEVG